MIDERLFYSESKTTREISLNCPHCRTRNSYSLAWLVRRKKASPPPGGGPADRAKFAKCQSYMVLIDNQARCANVRCRRTFDVSGVRTTAFLDD